MAASTELHHCKSVAKAEQLVRKYSKDLNRCGWIWSWERPESISESDILYYKLLTLALNKHGEMSKANLPKMLHDTKHNAHRNILKLILSDTQKVTYEEFIDIFEFDSIVTVPSAINYVEKLDNIITDKPIHFTVVWNNRSTSFDKYSTILPEQIQEYAYALRYKQVNFPRAKRTIWDEFLKQSTISIDEPEPIADAITKLQQQIKALKTIKDLA